MLPPQMECANPSTVGQKGAQGEVCYFPNFSYGPDSHLQQQPLAAQQHREAAGGGGGGGVYQ